LTIRLWIGCGKHKGFGRKSFACSVDPNFSFKCEHCEPSNIKANTPHNATTAFEGRKFSNMLIISTLLIAVAFFASMFAIITTIRQSMPRIIEVVEQRNSTSISRHSVINPNEYGQYVVRSVAANLDAGRGQNIIHKSLTLRRPIAKRKTQTNSMFSYTPIRTASNRPRWDRVKKA
jgi:hypothetical protein